MSTIQRNNYVHYPLDEVNPHHFLSDAELEGLVDFRANKHQIQAVCLILMVLVVFLGPTKMVNAKSTPRFPEIFSKENEVSKEQFYDGHTARYDWQGKPYNEKFYDTRSLIDKENYRKREGILFVIDFVLEKYKLLKVLEFLNKTFPSNKPF